MSLPFGFSQPDAGEQIKLKEFSGRLVVVTVRAHETGIVTRFTKTGETDELVKVTMIEVDGPQPGTVHEGAVFGSIVYRLSSEAGRDPVVGRIGQGQAQNGNSPPWQLQPFNEADMAQVNAMFAARPDLVAAATPKPAPPVKVHAAPQQQPAQAPVQGWGNGAPQQAPPTNPWGAGSAGVPAQAQPAGWGAPQASRMHDEPHGTYVLSSTPPAQAPAAVSAANLTQEQAAALAQLGIPTA